MKEQFYTFAMTMPFPWIDEKAASRAVNAVGAVPGFYGIHPEYPYVMPVFRTLDAAIKGRDVAQEMGQKVANNIMSATLDGQTLVVGSPVWGKDAPGKGVVS